MRVRAVEQPSEIDFRPSEDSVLLATKTQDSAQALDDLRGVAGPELPIVCLQNGVESARMRDLFFDLDGTLTDPARGITLCLQHALRALGHPPPPLERLQRYIGPPLRGTFAELLATGERVVIEAAVDHYRERFAAVGLYENEVYPDVPKGLASLREAGHRLWVVTSKPGVYARRIVEHFGLTSLFHGVYGSELSGRNAVKAELITHVLACERLDPARVFMIGDRAEDIAGGRANRTGTIGVLWGYGSAEELTRAEPDTLVDSMASLSEYVDHRG